MAKAIFYGCTTRSNPRLKQNLDRLLELMDEDFIKEGEDICCGAPLILAGYREEAKEQAKKVMERFKSKGIDMVITPCPHCFTIIGREYEHVLGVDTGGIRVLHITQFIAESIKNDRIRMKNEINVKVSYHDPCYIGRQGARIYEEPREILSSIKGVKLEETKLTKDATTCCGGGGLLRAYLPKLAVEVAREKINSQIKPLGVDVVISSCPFCFLNLSEGAEKSGIDVEDIVELVVKAME